MNSWYPATCKHCGYEITSKEVANALHGKEWDEPAGPAGWVHSPPSVGEHWTENYDTKTHRAHPEDNRSHEQNEHGATMFLAEYQLGRAVDEIIRPHLGPQFGVHNQPRD